MFKLCRFYFGNPLLVLFVVIDYPLARDNHRSSIKYLSERTWVELKNQLLWQLVVLQVLFYL